MALNWTMLNPDRTPVPLLEETTVLTIESGAEVSLTIPSAPPGTADTAGGVGGTKKLKATGKLWVTEKRLIFVAPPVPAGTVAAFESLSVPLHCLLSTNYEQPLLGSNYLLVEIKPTADGGLTAGTKAEIRLKDQPLFQLVSVLNKTRERAVYMQRQPIEEDDLPAYASPSASTPAASASRTPVAETPSDAPPGYDA